MTRGREGERDRHKRERERGRKMGRDKEGLRQRGIGKQGGR
jgi:hypothetical protein